VSLSIYGKADGKILAVETSQDKALDSKD